MSNLEIRFARPEDRDPVLAFCNETWSWGDYITNVWDDWLQNPAGQLFVATMDGQPVGTSVTIKLKNDLSRQGKKVTTQGSKRPVKVDHGRQPSEQRAWSVLASASWKDNYGCGKKRWPPSHCERSQKSFAALWPTADHARPGCW